MTLIPFGELQHFVSPYTDQVFIVAMTLIPFGE
jgi:hypothetical protein